MTEQTPRPTDNRPTCTSYWYDESLVVVERTNPNAWIRSDLTIPVHETELLDRTQPAQP